MAQRLPTPGSDDGTWGDILNAYLEVSHNSDGTLANSVVGTSQIQGNAVTNAQLDAPTQTAIAAIAGKYVKPGGGIPSTDLASAVQTSLGAAGTAVQTVNGKTGTSVTLAASDVSAIPTSQLGVASGVATLDGNSTLTTAQLPSSVVTGGPYAPLAVNGKQPVRKDVQTIDVRDWGVIGDGTSRPLSTLYGSLGAAQAVYPQAQALTDELDWAAMESLSAANPGMSFLVHSSLHLIINRAIDPKNGQRWTIDGIIENTHSRNSPSTYQDQANVIRMGNMHPIVVKSGTGFTWPIFALSSITAGARIVTVTSPSSIAGGGYSLNVGDKVIVRSDTNPDVAGQGVTYDFEQINKVVSWNSSTGALELELPIKVTIPNISAVPSSGAGGAPSAPTLTAGATTSLGRFAAGTYSWQVTAINSSGAESAGSTVVNATLSANATQAFTWNVPSGAVAYRLYRTDSSNNVVLVAFLTTTSYTDIGVPTTLSNPKLLVNSGATDTSTGQPWWIVDDVHIKGKGKLIGGSAFGTKMGAWRCSVDIQGDCQALASIQACVDCDFRVRGLFTDRMLEVKMVAQDSQIFVSGSYKPDGTVTPSTTISIGEQAHGCDIEVEMFRGPEHTSNVRALEVYAQDIRVKGRLHDYSTGGQTECVAVKSNNNLGRQPADIDLDLFIRAGSGKTQYMVIGNDANQDTFADDADPTRVRYALDVRTPDGAAPTYAVNVSRGTELHQLSLLGDIRFSNWVNPGEVPEGSSFVLVLVTGAVTYTANTDTLVGTTQSLVGIKTGDEIAASLQQIATPTSGTWSDLMATVTVSAAGSTRTYIRNRSGTDVVFGTGNLFRILVSFHRRRI